MALIYDTIQSYLQSKDISTHSTPNQRLVCAFHKHHAFNKHKSRFPLFHRSLSPISPLPFPSLDRSPTLLIQAAVPVDLDPLISLIQLIHQPGPLSTAKLSSH